MPYYIGRIVDDVRPLIIRSPETFREKQDIDAQISHRALDVSLKECRVQVEDRQTGKSRWEPYDQLLFATGAIPIRLPVPGCEARGVFELTTLPSGIAVRAAVDQEKPRKAVIVGGGYIGLEMAENLVARGLEVAVVEKTPQVMPTLDPDMAALIAEGMAQGGVKLYLEESLQGFDVQQGKVQGVVTDRRTLLADLVILGLGVRPNSTLAARAGVPVGPTGGIRVNDRMQTKESGVWAAGNCAETLHLVSRRPFFIALGTVANKQGRVAGMNIGGGSARFPGVVGTAVLKVFDWEVARTGLQTREIESLGLSAAEARIESHTRAGYYPGTGRIVVKLFAEKGSGRLLGGQIVGRAGSAKRIDMIATALHAGLRVEEMINLDLGYSPPFSPAWDPVLIALRQLLPLL
jgi:NADPH-dependent 2,4-dienoyl-CoA reductase/sulfur reductase-like enzyme